MKRYLKETGMAASCTYPQNKSDKFLGGVNTGPVSRTPSSSDRYVFFSKADSSEWKTCKYDTLSGERDTQCVYDM